MRQRDFAKLPLSACIRLAVKDLTACEKKKSCLISMGDWCDKLDSKCCVCFAGSIMNNSFRRTNANPWTFNTPGCEQRFLALNEIRQGYIQEAVRLVYPDADLTNLTFKVPVPYYYDNTVSFKRTMRSIAKDLKKVGY